MSDSVPDVAGPDAADEPGAELLRAAHQAERASKRMSLRCSSRLGPSWMRAIAWIWSRISALEGRSPGRNRYSTPSCLAALRLAVKYSDSVRCVHQPGGEKGDLPPDAFVVAMRRSAPGCAPSRAGAGRGTIWSPGPPARPGVLGDEKTTPTYHRRRGSGSRRGGVIAIRRDPGLGRWEPRPPAPEGG